MKVKNLIIGAGPAGLAMAGRMKKVGQPFVLIEKSENVANSWRHHYDRLHLHTVKQLSTLPHKDFPENYPVYVPREKVVEYLTDYASEFEIKPIYNQEVKNIEKKGDQWHVKTQNQSYEADNVIISTGVNKNVNIPDWPGKGKYKGEVIHSRDYKNPETFQNKKVLVIGMGNTGAEISLDLAEHNVKTHISVRSPVSIIPRDVNGQPVQLTAKKLDKLPFGIGNWLGTQIRKAVIGDLSKYGLPLSKVHPTVQLKETGKTPVLDIGTAKAIKEERIKVHGSIVSWSENGINFSDGSSEQFDAILLATGYKAGIQDFLNDIDGLMDDHDLPKEKIGQGSRKGLYFLGYDNYKLGGILGTIKDDSLAILKEIIAVTPVS